MTRLAIALIIAAVMMASITPVAWAWGPGHEDVARAVFQYLPQDILKLLPPDAVQKAILTFAHYPDSFEPFQPDDIGLEAIQKLTDNGIKNRYGLHSDAGRAMAFVLIVDAFRERRYDHAALWIAALSHSTSDMAAINHDPLVHGLIYNSAYKLKLADGKSPSMLNCFDLSNLTADKAGADAWAKSIEPMLVKDDGRNAQTALVEIMDYGQEGAAFCGPRGIPIVTDAVAGLEQNDSVARKRSQQKLAELGAWAVGRTVRDTCAAMRLASTSQVVALTPAVQDDFTSRNDQFMHDRKLDDDALFAPLLRSVTEKGAPVIGVLIEPTWRMNDAMLGYEDRVLSAGICRSMSTAKRSYATLDVRTVLAQGLPSPQRMPVLILSATGLRNYAWLKVGDLNAKLQTYLDAGGRVLWIGGDAKPPAALAPIATALTRTEKQPLPFPPDQFRQWHLAMVGDHDNTSWSFVRSPSQKVGWSQPLCPWSFNKLASAELKPLLQLQRDGRKLTVAVLWTTADGKSLKGAYLPIYCLAPLLLTVNGRGRLQGT